MPATPILRFLQNPAWRMARTPETRGRAAQNPKLQAVSCARGVLERPRLQARGRTLEDPSSAEGLPHARAPPGNLAPNMEIATK